MIRGQYVGEPSFKWLYAAPWASLPAALLGLLYAFVHRHMQLAGYKPQENRVILSLRRDTNEGAIAGNTQQYLSTKIATGGYYCYATIYSRQNILYNVIKHIRR